MKCPVPRQRAVFIGVLFFLVMPLIFAQDRMDETRGDNLVIKIALLGPGNELYFWWGHIALVIEDLDAGTARFYDYGIFSFETENFFTNFAMGRLIYSSGVSPAEWNYNIYMRNNRDIILYTLDLIPEKREAVLRFAEKNILPENRDYFYHHFRDNCSTRIRDIIDFALDGQFKERFGTAPGRYTLREHIRRHMWFSPFIDWYLNFLMGQGIDRPITIWEEMFLPSEVARRIEDFSYIDPLGVERVLVTGKETLYKAAGRPVVLEAPPRKFMREHFFASLVISVLMLVFIALKKKNHAPFGISLSILGLFFGISGSLLFFMTFFTDHDYTYHNINILFINPLLLSAVPLGITVALNKSLKKRLFAEQFLQFLWTYVFFGCILSIALKLLPAFYQQNQAVQFLVLPFSLILNFIPQRAIKIARKKLL